MGPESSPRSYRTRAEGGSRTDRTAFGTRYGGAPLPRNMNWAKQLLPCPATPGSTASSRSYGEKCSPSLCTAAPPPPDTFRFRAAPRVWDPSSHSTTSPPSDAAARRALPPHWVNRVAISIKGHPPRAGQAGGPRARGWVVSRIRGLFGFSMEFTSSVSGALYRALLLQGGRQGGSAARDQPAPPPPDTNGGRGARQVVMAGDKIGLPYLPVN